MEEVIKKDFMTKRAQMKGKILKAENYKGRWFKLTRSTLSYCDGRIEVSVIWSGFEAKF